MSDSSGQGNQDADGHELEGGRYTMAEAARVKGVSYHTVSRAVRSGKLPAQRLGRMALIEAGDLQAWRPMRERAPRKYRRETEETTPQQQRPALAGASITARSSNRLATAIATLHEGAASRTIGGFGDWLASLSASLLSVRQMVVWTLNHQTDQVELFGSVGVEANHLAFEVSETASMVMRQLAERDVVQFLDAMMLDQLEVKKWLPLSGGGTVIAVPMRQGVRTVGLMIGETISGEQRLSEEDARNAGQFGSQAAIAIEHMEMRRTSHRNLMASPSLIDNLPVQVLAIDRFGQLVYVNDEVVRQWGDVVRDKYVGRHYSHYVGMFRRERLDGSAVRIEDHPFTLALNGKTVREAPYMVPGFFSAPRIFSLSAHPLHDEDGAISGAVLTSRDVTAELQAAGEDVASLEQLIEARRKVEVLGALVSDIARRENIDHVFDIVARRVCEALGADSSVVLTPTAESHMVVRAVHQLESESLGPGRVVHRLQVPSSILAMAQRELFFVSDDDAGPSGRVFLEESDARGAVVIPLLDDEDALGVVNVMFSNSMELRRVDREFAMALGRRCGHAVYLRNVVLELEASRRRMLTVLDQLPEAVVILDAPHGNVVAVNREAAALWGGDVERSGLRGSDITMLDQDGRPIRNERHHPFLRPLHTRETELGVPMMTVDA